MPTKDELEHENAELRERVEQLESGAAGSASPGTAHNTVPPRPERPKGADGKPVLSAGELDDLRNAGVTTSPFTGEELNALDEGVETTNPDAKRAAERARDRKRDRARNDRVAGDPPATE